MTKSPPIPPKRVVLYSLVGSLLLVCASTVYSKTTISQALQQRQHLQLLGNKIERTRFYQKNNRDLLFRFSKKDPLFLHKTLGSLSPLSAEKAFLQKRFHEGVLPEDSFLVKRNNFLSSGENRFVFVETSMELGALYKETIEHQTKPVELSSQDLEQVLLLIEASSPMEQQKPHLIISDARLERKKSFLQEVWSAHFSVVRREYFE